MWQASSFPDTLIYLSVKRKKKFWGQLPGKRLHDLILGDLPASDPAALPQAASRRFQAFRAYGK